MHNQPSNWQKKIEGEWHGLPSIFDARGNHCGYNKVFRSSVFQDGQTTYQMNTKIEEGYNELLPRLEVSDIFSFGVIDSDQDRIYLGPDFIGAGHPYGALVDAHYYAPGWTGDLRTMVHILPDGQTQVYSSLIYDGPTLFTVFNGMYKVAFDYHTNPETQERIAVFCETERVNGRHPHILPAKKSGAWTGEMSVYDPAQQLLGVNQVHIAYQPLDLLRAEMTVTIRGVFDKKYTFKRYRNHSRHYFEGPDLFGNSMGYGRALYTSQHFYGEALKIKGREFLIDQNFTLSVVWQFYKSDRMLYTTFGLLHWREA
ncbi:MAG: hypothetical protein HND44_05310 [Chloroflexi bacterium]|nr:hypothetical protein [Ardenticatenaceae bacterium]MBL1127912.1 hypothetical protein [Chloroflexota bacterium]NOG33982.1 hypothetical protein [Chloroflexota bacterium]GIK55667.1 MAG: hypothetical protein BroJett015_13300 [Chloroflexota bacterium]